MGILKAGLAVTFLLLSVTAYAAENDADANRFWRMFRQAVLHRNNGQIASMTRFPFEVRGPDDSDPVRFFERKAFPDLYKQVVSQQVFVLSDGNFIAKTMLQLIKEKKEITSVDYLIPTSFTVHEFEFQLINGHWLFTRAYLEE